MLTLMSQSEQELFDIILVVIGVVAIILNVTLIIVTLQSPNKPKEVNVILGLTVVDILLPVAAIIAGIPSYMGDSEPILIFPCSLKGPFDFGLLVISVILVSIIAIQRYSRVLTKTIPTFVWVLFFGYSFSYLFLILVAAFTGEFQTSAGGVDCTPDPDNSTLSLLVLFFLGFSFLVYLAITLFCYIRVMIYATAILRNQGDSIELKHLHSSQHRPRPKRRTVIARTIIICLIYFFLLAPPGILIMLESTGNLPGDTESYSLAISTFVSSISLANPFLVLFVHAIIYNQLVSSILSLFSKVIPNRSAHRPI